MKVLLPSEIRMAHAMGKPYRKKLTQDAVFYVDGAKYTIREGFWWDGTSFPRLCWSLMGSPFTGEHVIPSLFHDMAYGSECFERWKADEIFEAMMEAAGVGAVKRATMYRALSICGWSAWNKNTEESIEGCLKHLEVLSK